MQRYSPHINLTKTIDGSVICNPTVVVDAEGGLVRYDEAISKLDHLRDENAKLREAFANSDENCQNVMVSGTRRYRNRGDHSVKVEAWSTPNRLDHTTYLSRGHNGWVETVLFDLLFEPDEP